MNEVQKHISDPPAIGQDSGWKNREMYLKKHICRSIFSSFLFDYQHESPVEPSRWRIRRELKQRYRGIYNELFLDPDASPLKMKSVKRKKCLNPWSMHYVSVHKHPYVKVEKERVYLEENVFMCLVRETQSGVIRQYFISREYNIGEGMNHTSTEHIPGRFIFEFRSTDPLLLHALAEQPAYITMEENVELAYLQIKGDKELGR